MENDPKMGIDLAVASESRTAERVRRDVDKEWPGNPQARAAMDARTADARAERARTDFDPSATRAERLSLSNVEEAFRYQPWNAEQMSAGDEVRAALVNAAKVILTRVPESPLRTRALNNLVDARMIANAAITFRGKF